MRIWIATALLAGAWLFGLGYFDPVQSGRLDQALVGAVLLLGGLPVRFPAAAGTLLALLLSLPALWIVPFPYRSMPLLLFCGLAVSLLPVRNTVTRVVARGAVLASLIQLPQALALLCYQSMTARSHELPDLLARPVAWLMQLLGAATALDRASLVLQDTGIADRIATTWELLLDPATLSAVVGGVALLAYLAHRSRQSGGPWRAFLHSSLLLASGNARLAAPASGVRGLAGPATATACGCRGSFRTWARLLVSSWIHTGLVCVLAVLLSRLVPLPGRGRTDDSATGLRAGKVGPSVLRQTVVTAGFALAVFALAFLVLLDARRRAQGGARDGCRTPFHVGSRRRNRIAPRCTARLDPTTTPRSMSTAASSTTMSRLLEDTAIDDAALGQCDVLIIKTPTSRYAPDEVEAVVRFVDNGGSLLMIGDHTNVFNMNTYLNDIARRFGFTFRNDLLFRVGRPVQADVSSRPRSRIR